MQLKKLKFYRRCLSSYLYYKIGKYRPIVLVISPTLRCNLKCRYCNVWFNRNAAFPRFWKKIKKTSLDKDKLISLINESYSLGIAYVSFSGGEPLLVKGVEHAGLYARKKGIFVNLNTNGTLLFGKRAERILNSFDQIRVSLNGLEETHDKLCGIKGTFEKIDSNLYKIQNLKRNAKIGLNFLLNETNEHELEGFIGYFRNRVDFISILPRFDFNQCSKSQLRTLEGNKRTVDVLSKFKPKVQYRKEFAESSELTKYPECDAGKLYMFICADYVLPCPFLTEKMNKGWVYKNDYVYHEGNLAEIFNSLKDNKDIKCLGCKAHCTSEISAIFRSSPLKLFKNLWGYKKVYHV